MVNKKLCKLYGSINKIVGLTSDDAISAIYQDGDYEDNMLANSANRAMCDMIVTRNIKHFKENVINTFTPLILDYSQSKVNGVNRKTCIYLYYILPY